MQIADLMPVGMPGKQYGHSDTFRKVVKVDISNDGSAKATNLILRLLPYDNVSIQPASGEPYTLSGSSHDRVSLGELLPGEAIGILAWDSDSYNDSSTQADEITLFFDDEYAEADVHEMVPSFWVGVAKFWGLFPFVLGVAVLLWLPVIVNSLTSDGKSKGLSEAEAPGATDSGKPIARSEEEGGPEKTTRIEG